MKVLETEKSNCGWFIRYEHFDWAMILAVILVEIIPVYGIIAGFQLFSCVIKVWEYVLIWILVVVSTVVALSFLIVFISTMKDHNFWFVTKEKFVTRITVPFDERKV